MPPEGTAMRRGVFFDRDASPGRIGGGQRRWFRRFLRVATLVRPVGSILVKISETPVLAVPQNRRMIGE